MIDPTRLRATAVVAGARCSIHALPTWRTATSRLVLALLTLSPLSAAADTLSPGDAVRLALARPDVRQERLAVIGLAASDRLQARAWGNPELRLEREDPDSLANGTTETSVRLSQEFEVGRRRALAREAADLGLEAAQLGADAAQQVLRSEVLDRYYTLLAHQRLWDAWQQHSAALERLLLIAIRRQEAGDLSGFERRRIAQLERLAQSRLAEQDAEVRSAQTLLAASTGVPDPTPAEDLRLAPPAPARLERLHAMVSGSTQLAALERSASAAEGAARSARSPMIPITIGIGQKRFEGGGDALLLDFAVPLPLFDRNQADITRTRALAEQARARHDRARIEAAAELTAAWFEADRLATAVAALREEGLPQAAQITRIATTSFEAGELDLVGLIDAFDSEIEAMEHTINLELRARRAALRLDRLTQGETP